MAVTENTYTGDGSTVLFSFTFPYLDQSHVKVSLNGSDTTAFTFANATTVQLNSAPANGVAVRIYRQTSDASPNATFFPGSAIRSADLNDNFLQSLYIAQETANFAAATDASAVLAIANDAQSTADAAVTTANAASATATAAENTANAISGTANTALSTANAALPRSGGTMTGQLLADDSTSAAAPAIAFDTDLNTGIYRPAADTVGIATGGVERMRIRSDGNIGIGGTGAASVTLYNQGSITGSTAAYGNFTSATVQSDVTGNAYGYRTTLTTAAAAFNLTYLHHYNANQAASFGAGSTVSNQFGFIAESTLTGAGNNYGFYGNIPSGTGRWNFYGAGTAVNYFAGAVGIGSGATAPSQLLEIRGSSAGTGATAAIRLWDTFSGTWTAGADSSDIEFYAADSNGPGAMVRSKIANTVEDITGAGMALTFATTGNTGGSALTERMRITSGGDVVVAGNLQAASINSGPLAGFRNAIINGSFDHWQRGTSFGSLATNGYHADRWSIGFTGGGTRTISRQLFPIGQTDVEGNPTYYLNWDQTVAGVSQTQNDLRQRIEGVRTFAGQQITISFYAKAAAAATISFLRILQNFGTGGSPSSAVTTTVAGTINLTTSWQRFSYSVTVPSISGKTLGNDGNDFLEVYLRLPLNTTFSIDIAQVQVELGPVATPFERRPIGTELALCQRYYEISNVNSIRFSGNVTSGSNYRANVGFAVAKRAIPNLVLTNASNTCFPTTNILSPAGLQGLVEVRTANATGAGLFESSWTADAEL